MIKIGYYHEFHSSSLKCKSLSSIFLNDVIDKRVWSVWSCLILSVSDKTDTNNGGDQDDEGADDQSGNQPIVFVGSWSLLTSNLIKLRGETELLSHCVQVLGLVFCRVGGLGGGQLLVVESDK